MKIKIDHIAKTEGHTGFVADIVKGDIKSAKLEIQDGIRLMEGILVGRNYKDVPIIAQRICGICPVVHNLTSIKVVENAFAVTPSNEAVNLRKLLEWGQIIHSHTLHLFFLSLADFLDIENNLKLVRNYPKETERVIRVREFGLNIVRIIGGRVIHPLTNEVGGFKKVPSIEDVQKLISRGEKILPEVLEMGEFFRKIKVPDFSRETEYVCLDKFGEYAIYGGDVISSKGLKIPVDRFETNFQELHRPKEVVKRVQSDLKTSYMVGAIARVNNQSKKLNSKATEYLESLGYKIPDYNPFHNILYQMVETIHAVEESLKILHILANSDLQKALTKDYNVVEGSAAAAVEAPRGTLYYNIEIDKKGYVKNVNIITPTAQFLSQLEDDIEAYIPHVVDLPAVEREKKLRAFVRAYDPCISCAVH